MINNLIKLRQSVNRQNGRLKLYYNTQLNKYPKLKFVG